MLVLVLFIFSLLIYKKDKFLSPFNLFLFSWSLYVGIKYLFEIFNDRYYSSITINAIFISTISFLFGFSLLQLVIAPSKKINSNSVFVEKDVGFKMFVWSIIFFCAFTVYLMALGVRLSDIITDSLQVRWTLGNGGNNIFTQILLVPLSVIPLIVFWNIGKVKNYYLVLVLLICFVYFFVLGLRGVIIDWLFSYLAIKSLKAGSIGLNIRKIFKFGIFAILIMTIIGLIRFNSQVSDANKVDLIGENKSEALNIIADLFFERLDFLDVTNAYLNKYEHGNRDLKIPIVPFFSNFIPRNLVNEKIYPTDTQVTHIAGEGYDQENITRIVGPIPELLYLGGFPLLIFWYFFVGVFFSYSSIKINNSNKGSFLQKIYSKQLLQYGSVPLFFGINTIFGTQFIIVTGITILTFYFLE
jgi:hypothetical protein